MIPVIVTTIHPDHRRPSYDQKCYTVPENENLNDVLVLLVADCVFYYSEDSDELINKLKTYDDYVNHVNRDYYMENEPISVKYCIANSWNKFDVDSNWTDVMYQMQSYCPAKTEKYLCNV